MNGDSRIRVSKEVGEELVDFESEGATMVSLLGSEVTDRGESFIAHDA